MNQGIIMVAFVAILLIIVCIGYWIGGVKGLYISMGIIVILLGLTVIIAGGTLIYQVITGIYPPVT